VKKSECGVGVGDRKEKNAKPTKDEMLSGSLQRGTNLLLTVEDTENGGRVQKVEE